MKIILLQGECPYPPKYGPHHHSLAVIRMLIKLNNLVTIIAYAKNNEETLRWNQFKAKFPQLNGIYRMPQTRGFKLLVASIFSVLQGFLPVTAKCSIAPLKLVLANTPKLGDADLIIADRYLVLGAINLWPNTAKLFLPHDAYSLAAERGLMWALSLGERLLWFRRYLGYRNMEKYASRVFDLIVPVSAVDLNHWKARHQNCKYECLPIAVEPNFLKKETQLNSTNNHLLIHGLFHFEAKCVQLLCFLEHIYPRLLEIFPNLSVTLWSPKLHKGLKRILLNFPKIKIQGWVDNYKEMLLSATVYYYPMAQSSGVQTKLLEAMALGLPCVASSETLSALEINNYSSHSLQPAYSVSNVDDTFNALCLLLSNKVLRQELGDNAKRLVQEHYTLNVLASKLAKILANCVALDKSV